MVEGGRGEGDLIFFHGDLQLYTLYYSRPMVWPRSGWTERSPTIYLLFKSSCLTQKWLNREISYYIPLIQGLLTNPEVGEPRDPQLYTPYSRPLVWPRSGWTERSQTLSIWCSSTPSLAAATMTSARNSTKYNKYIYTLLLIKIYLYINIIEGSTFP